MRFVRDDLGLEVPVTWYYVPDGRPAVPYFHPFHSRDADFRDGNGEQLLGEVQGTRAYYSGADPVELQGQGLCGTREQWERGASLLDSPLPLNPTTQQQCCCGAGSVLAPASIVFGCEMEVIMPPTILTFCKAQISAQNWDFTIAGVQDLIFPCSDTSLFNATWKISHLSGCTWRGPSTAICTATDAFRWHLMLNHPSFPGGWSLFAAATPVAFRWVRYFVLADDFLLNAPNILPRVEELDPALQFPAAVTIVPSFP